MMLIRVIFLICICFTSSHGAIITAKTKDIIHMDTNFNGTDITVFGTIKDEDIHHVSIEVLGPKRRFSVIDRNNENEIFITSPSFYAGDYYKTQPHYDRLSHYLNKNKLLQKAPAVHIKDENLFWAKIFLPAEAPTGQYHITYNVKDNDGKTFAHHSQFHIYPTGLQHILYRLATEYPLLNAVFVIISATFVSHSIRFMMRKK